jgi:protoporphyrin/coproporphyrin ferrochelatase
MRGIILINTGSPASPSPKDVGRYLSEFLMDERIIDMPFILRLLLVQGVIVPFRKYKSAKSYSAIWTNEGSPLLVNSISLARKVEDLSGIAAEVAMRYGSETVEKALARLRERAADLTEVVVVPMFPHYAMSSYESAALHAKSELQRLDVSLSVKIVEPFYRQPSYIDSLVGLFASLDLSQYDWLQFSYHSIPMRQLQKTISSVSAEHSLEVSYEYQVEQTSMLVAQQLGMADRYGVSYQSAMGRQWLGPSTSSILAQLPAKGVKRMLVISPAFVADNLETLKDINVEARKIFFDAGGCVFTYVPCLNDGRQFAQCIVDLVDAV